MTEIGQVKFDNKAFDERIARLAEPSFSGGEPHLISRLGIDLGPDLRVMRSALNLTLAEYIRGHLSEAYEVIEVKRNTSAIWPKGKAHTQAVREHAPAAPSGSKRAKRFKGWFWQAFSVPLTVGDRYYDPDAHEIRIVETGQPNPNWTIIPKNLIYSEDQRYDFKLVQKNVRSWLKESDLRDDLFLEEISDEGDAPTYVRSLLDHMLDALDRKQLQSVTMTLDAVAALASVRI